MWQSTLDCAAKVQIRELTAQADLARRSRRSQAW